MISLAALDIAGTTIDDRNLVYDALRGCVTETGTEVTAETLERHKGTEKRAAIEALLRAGGVTPDDALLDRVYGRFVELLHELYGATPPRPLPGVTEALQSLRGRGVSVVLTTGFTRDITTMVLQHAGWTVGPDGQVDAVVHGDDVPATRPAPYMIFRAMELSGTHNVRHVAVAGDTTADLLAGTHSGATIVAGVLSGACDRATLEAQPHTHILGSVAELPALIAD